MTDATATVTNIAAPAAWTREQVDLIKRTCVPAGALPTDDEFAVFLHVCKSAKLDPLLREAYLIERRAKDGDRWITTWQTMASRDGYLAVAQRAGDLRGFETFVYPEDASKPPTHATCRVTRAGWTAPVTVTVAFAEYIQRTRDNVPTKFWREKPRTMIGKVAQSQALRLAYSLHGTYTPDEMPEEYAERPALAAAPAALALPPANDAPPAWMAAEAAAWDVARAALQHRPTVLAPAPEAAPVPATPADPFADLADPPAESAAPRLATEKQRRLIYARASKRAQALDSVSQAAVGAALLAHLGIESSAAITAERVDDALRFVDAWLPPWGGDSPADEPGSAG